MGPSNPSESSVATAAQNTIIGEQVLNIEPRKINLLNQRFTGEGGIPSSFAGSSSRQQPPPPPSQPSIQQQQQQQQPHHPPHIDSSRASVTPVMANTGDHRHHLHENLGRPSDLSTSMEAEQQRAGSSIMLLGGNDDDDDDQTSRNNNDNNDNNNNNNNNNNNSVSNMTMMLLEEEDDNSNSIGADANSILGGQASNEAISHVSGSASQASCQTLITSHRGFKDGANIKGARDEGGVRDTTPPPASKKKQTPTKRPQSAIGDRQTKPTTPNNNQKTNAPLFNTGEGTIKKKARIDSKIIMEDCKSSDNALRSAPPANRICDSGSRDGTLFISSTASRDRGSYSMASNPSSRGAKNPSPAAPSSKSKSSTQKTINTFFLGAGLKKKNSGDSGGKSAMMNSGGNGDIISGDAPANVTSSSSLSTTTITTTASSAATTKSQKEEYSSPTRTKRSRTKGQTSSSEELERLKRERDDLESKLKEARDQNVAIKNSQNLQYHNLSKRMKDCTADLERVRKESGLKSQKAMDVIERLVREESIREAKELRQKLASDGARLGRLVTSRVGSGGGIMHSHSSIETWEDGHDPKMLKIRRTELRKKREVLERRNGELAKMRESVCGGDGESIVSSSVGHPSIVQSADLGWESSLGGRFYNMNDNTFPGNDLDLFESVETVRMHLDELKQKEAALATEQKALNNEIRGHIRALKLMANEDSSKFRLKHKLHDRYVLLNLLGKGGFSEVWRAYDLTELRHVAVKIHQLEPSWSDAKKENYTKHVSREYEIHRDVRHPRVVSLYDVFEIDTDSFATVLECCKGTDLDTVLKDRQRLPERDGRAILLQILSGMRYLSTPSADGRRQGVIHYDLKPGNILFDEQGNAKITDFGLSKIVDTADSGEGMELTSQGAGTYWYLPPECFLMDQDVRISNKVDVWSIGVIFFQMLFGRRPFGDGESQDRVLRNQTMLHATEVHFPANPTISEEGKAFIRDCLTYDQIHRPNMNQICEHHYLRLKSL